MKFLVVFACLIAAACAVPSALYNGYGYGYYGKNPFFWLKV